METKIYIDIDVLFDFQLSEKEGKPIKNAIKSVKKLKKNCLYEIYVFSNAPYEDATIYTEKINYLHKYFGKGENSVFYNNLIFSNDKSTYKADYIIAKNLKFSERLFEGEYIEFGSKRFPDWSSIVEYIEKDTEYNFTHLRVENINLYLHQIKETTETFRTYGIKKTYSLEKLENELINYFKNTSATDLLELKKYHFPIVKDIVDTYDFFLLPSEGEYFLNIDKIANLGLIKALQTAKENNGMFFLIDYIESQIHRYILKGLSEYWDNSMSSYNLPLGRVGTYKEEVLSIKPLCEVFKKNYGHLPTKKYLIEELDLPTDYDTHPETINLINQIFNELNLKK